MRLVLVLVLSLYNKLLRPRCRRTSYPYEQPHAFLTLRSLDGIYSESIQYSHTYTCKETVYVLAYTLETHAAI